MADIQEQPSAPSHRLGAKPQDSSNKRLRVVGIGVGEDGLKTIKHLFADMPIDGGLAFVICQNATSDLTGPLEAALADGTPMTIKMADEGGRLEGNTIYLMRPDARMILLKDRMAAFDHDEDGLSAAPFDLFLHALAASAGSEAIALLLAGAGEDGLRGAVSIRRTGGLVVVQDPKTAPCDTLLKAAISADLASLCAEPRAMSRILKRHIETGGPKADGERAEAKPAPPRDPEREAGPGNMSGSVPARMSEHYASHPAETIQPKQEIHPMRIAPTTAWPPSLPVQDELPGTFDGMLEQNQRMLESTIDTLLASNDALRRRNRDLRIENQRLTATNAALDDIATMVAHDLKAPLRSIDHLSRRLETAFTEAVGRESTARDDIRHLQLRLHGLHRLIDDLLTYARQGTKDDPGEEVVNICDLVREILTLIGLPSGFRIEVRPPSLQVRTRRIPLECILRNLLCNAIRHHGSSAGSIQVTVTALENAIDIRVVDDGQGVRGGSEGLGLAIVRQLLGTQAAELMLSSPTSGLGTEARFTWPANAVTTA